VELNLSIAKAPRHQYVPERRDVALLILNLDTPVDED